MAGTPIRTLLRRSAWRGAPLLLACGALAGLGGLTAVPQDAGAEGSADHAAPAASAAPLPAKAMAVFNTYCASCHQTGRTGSKAPDRFDDILDLDQIARDPRLVVPGFPDASGLYQRMLGHHAPLDLGGGANPPKGPSAVEFEAVRDWIEALPETAADCPERGRITPAETRESVRGWRALVGPEAARGLRFVTLAHLYNACVSDARLAAYRGALAALIANGAAVDLDTVSTAHALLAVDLSRVGWGKGEWDALTADAARFADDVITGDWLAEALVEKLANPESNGTGAGDLAADEAVAALRREWENDVPLRRAAAELGLSDDALRDRLALVGGEQQSHARTLLGLPLARGDWLDLASALAGASTPPVRDPTPARRGEPASGITLSLWTEKASHRVGDLLSLVVRTTLACHLTLVDVDEDGKAIVIFPNELEQDNLIAPGISVRIPGAQDNYRMRLDRAGRETIVGICQRASRRPEGISFDYEKQRFAILGNWRAFLRNAAERESDIKKSLASRERRKAAAENGPPVAPDGPALEGRAAIRIDVGSAAGASTGP